MKNIDFLLKTLGDGIGYPFCVFNAEESVVICNEEFERLLGVRDIAGITLKGLFEPTEFSPLVPEIRTGLRGVAPEPHTLVIDGFPVRQYQSVVKPIRREGEVVYAVITLADVSEKMESLEFALKARAFYNRVFEEMPQAYFMLDEDFLILRTNRAAEEMFGFGQPELLGKNLRDLLTFTGKVSVADLLHNFINTEETTLRLGAQEEILGVRSDTSVFPARASVIRSDLAQLRTYSVIVLDLSADRDRERRNLEQEKKQQGAMRNEALGKLAGKFAHDMNNVLAVIGGFSEILNITPREEDKEAIGEIMHGVKRAASLTARILAYTGRQQMETRSLSLNSFLLERENDWRDALGPSIRLKFDIDSPETAIIADEKLLAQVVFSLLANSREAMVAGGNVTLGLRHAHLDEVFFRQRGIESTAGKFIELFVADDGSGIPLDKQAMVFEPYFSTKDPNKSSGLGLAVVYGIIKQHRGFIFCESIPEKETVMRLFLPATEEREVQREPEQIISAIHPPDFTVLVVDDEDSILRILESALTRRGFKVFTAVNGRKALDFLQAYEGRIDLLISDVMMPEVSGIELAQSALQSYPNLPIIFITGYSQQIIDKNPVLRHFPVIAKPFSPVAIVAAAEREIALHIRASDIQDYSLPE